MIHLIPLQLGLVELFLVVLAAIVHFLAYQQVEPHHIWMQMVEAAMGGVVKEDMLSNLLEVGILALVQLVRLVLVLSIHHLPKTHPDMAVVAVVEALGLHHIQK